LWNTDLSGAATREVDAILSQQRERLRNLYRDLQSGADDRPPRDRDRKPVRRAAGPVIEERRDHCDVPRHRRGVRDEKFVMTVQHAEKPRRHHEQSRAGKQDAHDLNRQVALVALEARRDHVDQIRGHHHADRHQHRYAESQNRADAPGDHVGGFIVALAKQFSVNRDERRGQYALAEQVLQNVRDAKPRLERVCGGRVAEEMREDAVPDETGNPAEQHARGDRAGLARARSARARRAGARLDARFAAILMIGCDFGQVPSGTGSIATASRA